MHSISLLILVTLSSLVSSFYVDQQYWESCPFMYSECTSHCSGGTFDVTNNNNAQYGADWLKRQQYQCNSNCLNAYQQCMNGQQNAFNHMMGTNNNYNSQNSYNTFIEP